MKSFKIFLKFKPDVIVTTGAHTCVLMCYIAKLFKNEIDDFNSKDLKEPIKTDSYIFYRLQNCFDSINSVNASIKDNMNNIF